MELVRSMASRMGSSINTLGEKQALEKSLDNTRNTMKDPGAVQFRNVRIADFNNGKVVCGELNGKNGYGAYVGFSPFVADLTSVQMYQDFKSASVEKEANAGLLAACGPHV